MVKQLVLKHQKRRLLLIGLIWLFLISGGILLTTADESRLDPEQLYSRYGQEVYYLKAYRADGSLKTVGTAFLIKGQKALTAAHVVKDASKLELMLPEGTAPVTVKVLTTDDKSDLAVLQTPFDSLKGLDLSAAAPKHGQAVFVIGYPLKETPVITEGIVASPKALINGQSKLLMTATVAPGMSGGPVLNHNGQVVGVVSGSTKVMNELHLAVDYKVIQTMTGGK